jgi:pilus assembly protein CpaF
VKATIYFADGERDEGTIPTGPLGSSFEFTPNSSNTKMAKLTLSSLKYIIFNEDNPVVFKEDPRRKKKLQKVVLRFRDGDIIRTYKDDYFSDDSERVSLQAWEPTQKVLLKVLAPQNSLKGIYFVEEWDSRSQEEKQSFLFRQESAKNEDIPVVWTGIEEETTSISEKIRQMAPFYQQRLAKTQSVYETMDDPTAFTHAIQENLDRMLKDDGLNLNVTDRNELFSLIIREAVGFGAIDSLVKDPSVTEIMVNAPDKIFIERDGQLLQSKVVFASQYELLNTIRKMAQSAGRRIDESSPMVDARLSDGSRLNAAIPPIAPDGPTMTIRKFSHFVLKMNDLIKKETLSASMASFLQAVVKGRTSILISGGTGTGKTTTMNILGGLVPPRERIITIEDSAELQLSHPHVLRLEYHPPNVEGKAEITIRQLLKNSLRMRPDRIMVGEVRDAAALDMLQAMNTGHEGSMSTIHSNSAVDAFSRLETMVLSGSVEIPLSAIRAQIISALQIVIHQARMPDGSRKIVQIAEVKGYADNRAVLKDIYLYHRNVDGSGFFRATGAKPEFLERLAFYNVFIPDELFDPEITKAVVKQHSQVLLNEEE